MKLDDRWFGRAVPDPTLPAQCQVQDRGVRAEIPRIAIEFLVMLVTSPIKQMDEFAGGRHAGAISHHGYGDQHESSDGQEDEYFDQGN